QPFERQHFGFVGGIEIDNHHRRALDIDLLAIGQPCVDDVQADLRAGAECGARGGLESIVNGQNDHSCLESGSDGAAATHGSDLVQTWLRLGAWTEDHCEACCGGEETTVVVVEDPDPMLCTGPVVGGVTCSVGGAWLLDSICIGSTG